VSGFNLAPRPAACLSDLKLDRLLGGELDGSAERETALAHLATCPRCQQRRDEIAAQSPQLPDEALFGKLAPPAEPPRARAPRRRAPLVAAISLLAAAAAVVLVARPRPHEPLRSPADTRLKGGDFGFEILVRRKGDGRAAPVLPEEPVHPGDLIGFRVRSPSGGHLAIVSVDGAGGVSSYLPGPAGQMPRLPPGEQAVDGAVRLDAVLGRETVFAVLCADAADAGRALGAVRAAVAAASAAGELPRLALPCAQARAVMVKGAP
jgi:hypothetical protein